MVNIKRIFMIVLICIVIQITNTLALDGLILDHTETLNVSIANAISTELFYYNYSGKSHVIALSIFDTNDNAISNLKNNSKMDYIYFIVNKSSNPIIIVKSQMGWLSNNILIWMISSEDDEIVNHFLSLYPSTLTYPPQNFNKSEMMYDQSIISVSSSCDCWFGNICVGLPDACWTNGAQCYYLHPREGCYYGGSLSNGNDDWCSYKSQVPHTTTAPYSSSATGCSRGNYDCDFNSECSSRLNCVMEASTICVAGNECGCCYDSELWDSTTNRCKTSNGNICSSNLDCISNYCVHGICNSNAFICGDNYCDSTPGENYDNCFQDCIPPIGHIGYCSWKSSHGQSCAHNEWDCDDGQCASGLTCKGPTDGDIYYYDGCCYDYEDWNYNTHTCYDPRLEFGKTDCNLNTSDNSKKCKDNLYCLGDGDNILNIDDGCCYDYQNWYDNGKICNNAIYGKVKKVTSDFQGNFLETNFGNINLHYYVLEDDIFYDDPSLNKIVPVNNQGEFSFNPERYLNNWNGLSEYIIDKIDIIENNIIIGTFSNQFNSEDNYENNGLYFKIGKDSVYQNIRVHYDKRTWNNIQQSSQNIKSVSTLSNKNELVEINVANLAPALSSDMFLKESKQKVMASFAIKDENIKQIKSLRWNGTMVIDYPGEYTFSIPSMQGVRLVIDNNLLIDDWYEFENLTNHTGTISLTEGKHVTIIELFYYVNDQEPKLYYSYNNNNNNNNEFNIFNYTNLITQSVHSQRYSISKDSLIKIKTYAMGPTSVNADLKLVSFIESPGVVHQDKVPLVLIHGFHGKSGYWKHARKLFSDNGYDVWEFYYPNDDNILYSAGLLKDGINTILKKYPSKNKVDIIAHSMGGLVTRAYLANMSTDTNGNKISYGNNIRRLLMLGTPNNGNGWVTGIINNWIGPGLLCGSLPSQKFSWLERNCFFLGHDPDAPTYSQMSLASDLIWNLSKYKISEDLPSLVIIGDVDSCKWWYLGKQKDVYQETQDNEYDCAVAFASASLLNLGTNLAIIHKNHVTEVEEIDDYYNIINEFLNENRNSVIKSYSYQNNFFTPNDFSSASYSEGALGIKFINIKPTIVSIKSDSLTANLEQNSISGNWFHFGRSDSISPMLCIDADCYLTIPKGNYTLYLDGTKTNYNIEIKPIQTNYYEIGICLPSWQSINTTCRPNDYLTTYYLDSNNCGYQAPENKTMTCDYCTPNWNCSEYATCQVTNLKYCNKTNDINICFLKTNLTADLYNGNYTEFSGFFCDYCVPSWNSINTTCKSNNTFIEYFNDLNNCYSITNISSDLIGRPSNLTHSCDYCLPAWQCGNYGPCFSNDNNICNQTIDKNSCYQQTGLTSDLYHGNFSEFELGYCDYNGDHVVGNLTHTNIPNLTYIRNNETNISFSANNKIIIEFNYNLSRDSLNLYNVSINKQSEDSNYSFIIITGLDLVSKNTTKTIYLDKKLGGTGLCIKDAVLSSITEITSACNEINEFWLACPGQSGNYNCNLYDNSTYKITGLKHSGIIEQTTHCGDSTCNGLEDCTSCSADCGTCQSSSSSSGGGGGGGGGGGSSTVKKVCTPLWDCTDWSKCINGYERRTCIDQNKCNVTEPETLRRCARDLTTNTNNSAPKVIGSNTTQLPLELKKNEVLKVNQSVNSNKSISPITGRFLSNINYKPSTIVTVSVILIIAIFLAGLIYWRRKVLYS